MNQVLRKIAMYLFIDLKKAFDMIPIKILLYGCLIDF